MCFARLFDACVFLKLSVVAVAVPVIIMVMTVPMIIAIMGVTIAMVTVVFVLAVVVAVIVPDFVVVLVSVPVILPATVASPVSALTAPRERAPIAEVRVEITIDVAAKTYGAAEPGSGAKEQATHKPLWAVVAERRALIGRVIEVAVGADRRSSYLHVDADLRRSIGRRHCQKKTGKHRNGKKPEQLHYILLAGYWPSLRGREVSAASKTGGRAH